MVHALPHDPRWQHFQQEGDTLDVPQEQPMLGWRWWVVSEPGAYGRPDPRLVAPFAHSLYRHEWSPERDPIYVWRPGVNTSRMDWCRDVGPPYYRGEHSAPEGWCWCGIRSMRSLPELHQFHRYNADSMAWRGLPLRFDASAVIASWGRVCGPNDRRDRAGTIRAQYAAIVGPLYVRRARWAEVLSAEYGVEARVWPADWLVPDGGLVTA